MNTKTTENENVMERVKTFWDACNELGKEHPFVQQFDSWALDDRAGKSVSLDLVAYLQLRIIAAALNEGWEPQFADGDFRYYPAFTIRTVDEVDKLTEEDRRKIVAFGDNMYLACVDAVYAPSPINVDVAASLCFKTKELALYAGKQFAGIWAGFYMTCKQK